jgi:hypothetical protein
MSAAIKLSLPVGLAVLYAVGALIWYELLRSQLMDLLAWRQRRHGRERRRRRRGASGEAGAAAVAGRVQLERELERGPAAPDARMHYLLARKAAVAERDAAVEAASEATRRAIERIEQRYGRAGSAEAYRMGGAAKGERDAAVEAANAAAKQAIERIERRYREIDWALEDEEEERIGQMLGRAER